MSDENTETLTDDQKSKLPELSAVVDLLTKIQAKQDQDVIDKEVLVRLTGQVEELSKTFSTRPQRRAEWDTVDADSLTNDKKITPGAMTMKALMETKSDDPQIEQAQEVLDRAYILSEITGKPVSELKYFKQAFRESKVLQKAVGTSDLGNTGVGGALTGWQPANFSQRMIEKVRLQLVVANLHGRIQMPSDPYRFPIEGNDPIAYRVTERSGDNDYGSTGNWVPSALSSLGAGHLTLASTKLGGRIALSNEADEDSFIPIMQYVEDKLIFCMAEAQENVTINGWASGATLDTETNLYTNQTQLTAWNGYRQHIALSSNAAAVNAGGTTSVDIANIRQVRQQMGKYGINPRDLVMVCGPVGYIKLLGLKDGNNPSPVLTLDKYGSQATILNGELAKVDGIPILVSPMIGPYINAAGSGSGSENLNAAGVYDGVTQTFTEILFVRPSAFIYGDRRQATLKSREVIETDQQVLVVLQRMTFTNLYPTQAVVGSIYNIKK